MTESNTLIKSEHLNIFLKHSIPDPLKYVEVFCYISGPCLGTLLSQVHRTIHLDHLHLVEAINL